MKLYICANIYSKSFTRSCSDESAGKMEGTGLAKWSGWRLKEKRKIRE